MSDEHLRKHVRNMWYAKNDFSYKYDNRGVKQPTSLQAKMSVDHMTIAEKVLCELNTGNFTDDELEQQLEMPHQTVSSSRRQCYLKGWVVPTGDTRPTRSGRQANVWELTPEGKQKVNEILERKDK
tara:strand:- start:114 stop:491 length:378 start_codon:yes stop_codon:yes gene_type:complete